MPQILAVYGLFQRCFQHIRAAQIKLIAKFISVLWIGLLAVIALPSLASCAPTPRFSFLIFYHSQFLGAFFSVHILPMATIIAVESFCLYKLEQLKYFRSLFLAVIANIFILISGIYIFSIYRLFYIFSASSFFPSLIIISATLALCFGLMLGSFCERTGYLAVFRAWKFYRSIPLLASVTFWAWNMLNFGLGERVIVAASAPYALASIPAWIAAASIILNGFVFNLVAKAWIVAAGLPKHNLTLAATTFSMNVLSYLILAAFTFLSGLH